MKLVILDRDGVINYDSPHYIRSPQCFKFIPGSIEAIATLTEKGYTIAVATNQSGIARGYYNHETLAAIHHAMQEQINAAGGHIDYIAYCPHHPKEDCHCRKPKPGLLQAISRHYQTSLKNVIMVGDKITDAESAITMEARPVLVQTGLHSLPDKVMIKNIHVPQYENLKDALSAIL